MDRTDRSRRGALRLGGAALVGVISGLSGCPSAPLGGDGSQDSGEPTLPSPDALQDVDHYRVATIDVEAYFERESNLSGSRLERVPGYVGGYADTVGLSAEEIRTFVESDAGWRLLTGSFDVGELTDRLREQGHEVVSESGDATVLSRDAGGAIGVTGDALALPARGGVDTIETLVDPGSDDTGSYTRRYEAFGVLLDELGDGVALAAGTHGETTEPDRSAPVDRRPESVRVDAYHQNEAGDWTNRTVLRRSDLGNAGIAQRNEQLGPHVPVSVANDRASGFQQDLVETGVARRTTTRCGWPGDPDFDDVTMSRGPCLLTVVDGEVVYSSGMSRDLGRSMVDGTWAQDPQFVLQTSKLPVARQLSINLRAGRRPMKLHSPFDAARFEGEVATGSRVRIDDGTVRRIWVKVFPDGDGVPVDALRRWVRNHEDGGLFGPYRDVSVSESGRAGVVTATADPVDLG
jgi:hypothetical protein